MLKRIAVVALSTAALLHVACTAAGAGERASTRSHARQSVAAASDPSVEVWHGQRRSTTTWIHSSGRRGDAFVKTTWDPEPRKKTDPEDEIDDAASAESGEAAAGETASDESDAKASDSASARK
jgi:hypothetical protein